ncbi:MAG TPA: DUF3999 family protein [Ramlibacter sp.]|nr:DUF3999 family protein [Ramlibacter sp.]
MNRASGWACALAALLACGGTAAQAPAPAQFSWRAPLELPAGASLARASLPAQALMQLQSADARDLRVFNGNGEAVAFAFIGTPGQAAPPPEQTVRFAALPLYSSGTNASARPAKGAMRVRVQDGDQRSVWVQIDGRAPDSPAARPLQSVLFDTRTEERPIAALKVSASLPPNTPVRLRVSTSADLAQWSSATVSGRLYRFEGPGAPANDQLAFEPPLTLKDRYLRLDWDGQEGVAVSAVHGVVAPAIAAPPRQRAELPPLQADGPTALQLRLPFATPIAALQLSTPQANTLLPVRILGRSEVSQPWRSLGHAVVWRLGGEGSDNANPATPLHGASVRWLRVESTNGSDLGPARLQATVEFAPLQLAFVATGSPPFTLAVGRPETPAAALPASMLAGTLGGKKLDSLPEARLGPASITAPAPPDVLDRLLPEGLSRKTAVLWVVLLAGVLLLAGVAWSLLRQLKQ